MCLSVLFINCAKEEVETETTTSSSTTTTTTTSTEVIMSVVDSEGNPKSGYSVLMFLEQPSETETLPTIEKEVISNSEGLSTFDLDTYIVSATTVYFEAFTKEGENYVWESITHPTKTISKGTKWTTSTIVD